MRALSKSISLAASVLIVGSCCCQADALFTDSAVFHGRVTALDRDKIVLQVGCNANESKTINWTEAREVLFDASCDASPTHLPSAGGAVCASAPVRLFVVYFRTNSQPIYATEAQLSANGVFNYVEYINNKVGHGPISEVRGIALRSVCKDDISEGAAPSNYCVEQRRFAVNFSYDTPLDNKVLTQGFSFFLEKTPPDPPDARSDTEALKKLVQDGFAAALGLWTSELWQRREHYDKRLAAFLDTRVSKSSNFILFTQPQVVSLDCPQSATFIIRVYRQAIGPFAANLPRKAAYAERPGRTILLNFAQYPCWQHANLEAVIDPQTHCINIDPILMHELGHAFGLGHSTDTDSIMNEVIHVTKPLEADLNLMAGQLVRSVQGDRPGVFEFVPDNGVAVE